MPRVDICFLEVGEYQFTGGSVVAMGPQEHVGQLELGSYLQEIL